MEKREDRGLWLFRPCGESFLAYHPHIDSAYVSLDIRGMGLPSNYAEYYAERIRIAQKSMQSLESGGIANPDEGRQVGHYWLRNPELAPDESIKTEIQTAIRETVAFASAVRCGKISTAAGAFQHVILVGIGGSALGPQLLDHACAMISNSMTLHFLDNVDPDGLQALCNRLDAEPRGFERTLVVVASKSGSTVETELGASTLAVEFARRGLSFQERAVAVTMKGSPLSLRAQRESWLAEFPLWDWVGGRTSLCSSVGLLPAALLGLDVEALLAGAREMDAWTSPKQSVVENLALILALAWFHGVQQGRRQMVVLPYKDRLLLLPRYLQQLVMESLGKGRDVAGHLVKEGLVVYGNKGSTDQHAYIQQLREGDDGFFAAFIQVQKDHTQDILSDKSFPEQSADMGDYLLGCLLGTRLALHENGRASFTITIPTVSPYTIGMLVALFERTVGYYASMVGINAYHQPGVEAGKQAAKAFLTLQRNAVALLNNTPCSVSDIARKLGEEDLQDDLVYLLEHLVVNNRAKRVHFDPVNPTQNRYVRL